MTWSTWVSQKATEVTKRSECPALTIDRAFFVPFVLFCKHSWSRPSFLCCFDFGPGRRVPELGEAMPAQGEQGVPVGREGDRNDLVRILNHCQLAPRANFPDQGMTAEGWCRQHTAVSRDRGNI